MHTIIKTLIVGAMLASVTFLNAGHAAADSANEYITVDPGQSKMLEHCKGKAGSVEAKQIGDTFHVSFKDVECATLEIYSSKLSNTVLKSYKISGKSMPRSGSFTLPKSVVQGAKWVKMRIRSNSGKHADWIYIKVGTPRVELRIGKEKVMKHCGGVLKITSSMSQGTPQVSVVLKNVSKCDHFTIESNNGRVIGTSYPIQGGKPGRLSASFGLSWKKVIDKGGWGYAHNQVLIKVSGAKTEDLYKVSFDAQGN